MSFAKVISDGSPQGTKIYDGDGKEIKGASAVTFYISAGKHLGRLIVEFPVATCEVLGEESLEPLEAVNSDLDAMFKALKANS